MCPEDAKGMENSVDWTMTIQIAPFDPVYTVFQNT